MDGIEVHHVGVDVLLILASIGTTSLGTARFHGAERETAKARERLPDADCGRGRYRAAPRPFGEGNRRRHAAGRINPTNEERTDTSVAHPAAMS
jgi:hypothetical protein